MQLIGIAYGVSDFSYRKFCSEKKLRRAGHAVFDQVFLRPLANPFFEQFQKLVAMDIAALRNGLYGNIVHKIFFNIEKSGLNLLPYPSSPPSSHGRRHGRKAYKWAWRWTARISPQCWRHIRTDKGSGPESFHCGKG
nr:hypothetical protein [Mediterraneibacter glycyrrhizinilyticus]